MNGSETSRTKSKIEGFRASCTAELDLPTAVELHIRRRVLPYNNARFFIYHLSRNPIPMEYK